MLKFRAQSPDPVGVAPTSVVAAPAPPNGGFPEPWTGEAVQLVRCRHEACGGTTLVRLPPHVPTHAVRVVVCGTCQQSFEVDRVEELGTLAPARREKPMAPPAERRRGGSVLEGRRALIAAPIGLAAVVAGLLLIQGGDSSSPAPTDAGAGSAAATEAGDAPAAPSPDATLIRGSSYTVALPSGWLRTRPPKGATFAARAAGGGADAALWVRREPSLEYSTFVAQSLERLRTLAGSAHVASRVTAPTDEGTIVRLEAAAPPGKPLYDVTLRAAGPYRYYLATTLEPGSPPLASKGVDLVTNSLTPTTTTTAEPAP